MLLLKQFKQNGKKIFLQLLIASLFINMSISSFQVFFSLLHLSDSRDETVQIEDQVLFDRPTGIFLHSNELALFLLLFWTVLPKDNKSLTRIVTVGAWLMIIFSQSRSVWFAGVTSFLILLCVDHQLRERVTSYLKKSWLRLWQFPLGLFLGVFFFFIFILPRIYTIRYTLLEGSGAIRLEMIKDGWTLLQFSPVYGFGANTNVLTAFFYLRNSYLRDFPYAVHTAYLQLSLEAGLLGSFFFFLPFIYLFAKNVFISSNTGNVYNSKNIFLLMSILIYFLFQPHGGRFEIPLLGIILGYIVYTTGYEKGRS